MTCQGMDANPSSGIGFAFQDECGLGALQQRWRNDERPESVAAAGHRTCAPSHHLRRSHRSACVFLTTRGRVSGCAHPHRETATGPSMEVSERGDFWHSWTSHARIRLRHARSRLRTPQPGGRPQDARPNGREQSAGAPRRAVTKSLSPRMSAATVVLPFEGPGFSARLPLSGVPRWATVRRSRRRPLRPPAPWTSYPLRRDHAARLEARREIVA